MNSASSDPFSPSVYSETGKTFGDDSDTKDTKPPENNKKKVGPQKRNTNLAAAEEKGLLPRLSCNLGKENKSREAPSGKTKASDKRKTLKGRALKSLSVGVPVSKASPLPPPKKETINPIKIFTTEEGNGSILNKKSDDALSETGKGCPSPEYDGPSDFSLAESRKLLKIRKSSTQIEIEKFLMKHARKPLSRFPTYEQIKDENEDLFIKVCANMRKTEHLRESYKRRFTLDKLLKIVPNPWMYFSDKERDCSSYSDHSLNYLKMKFRKHYNRTISDALFFHNHNLYLTYKHLAEENKELKLRAFNRSSSECIAGRPNSINPQFLFEVMFIESEDDVKIHMRNLRLAKNLRLREAKTLDGLACCKRCLQEDLLPEDVISCNKGHSFCKSCIVKYFESKIARGSFCLKCLYICEEKYPMSTLQELLDIETFSKLVELYEIFESNDIPGLVQCPFCKYFRIEPDNNNIIMCLNPECLLIYCRKCKELDHEPKKCKKVKDKEVEVKYSSHMSKIGIQKCWKCEHELVKEEGCNEMNCLCGSRTCYVCKNPVEDHSHFFLYEDEDGSKCPLYTTDFRMELD